MTEKYLDLELSTQIVIAEAERRGVQVEVLDRKDNFIRLRKGSKIEYIRRATETSADSIITYLLMENKHLTKLILQEHGFSVPGGTLYESIEQGVSEYHKWANKQLVIKPNKTNFGTGISFLSAHHTENEYFKGLEHAFGFDGPVIVERYIEGKEFRFLVINNSVVGIIERVPAHVLGDGTNTIRELVDLKNQDPRRGTSYNSPLIRINLGAVEERHLMQSGLTFTSIPEPGIIVFLRQNSNMSTGGETIDRTDSLHPTYKDIAVKAVSSIGAKICGLDMIISDSTIPANQERYAILECNFNPILSIHNYPSEGMSRDTGKAVLDLLAF